MKKIAILALTVAVISAAFIKSRPPSFENDMSQLKTYVMSKANYLSTASTTQDSINIAQDIKTEGDQIVLKWDVEREYENRMVAVPCWWVCTRNFITCVDRGEYNTIVDCLRGFINCLKGCFLPD